MFEAFIVLWTIIILLFSGGSNGGKLLGKSTPPNPPNPPGVVDPNRPIKEIPTPALLPGMIIFLSSVLRKKAEKDS
ncbi:MAG: PTPA-CTERM sorting domain-containing protein [Tildeniella nuda ZEHNDER 1965/U140]|jgi:hypothetical protein|nr:PTPA-CTERM sorting domain-containing protein [Tildeniella nuda ZEHNDER 1965/U140]